MKELRIIKLQITYWIDGEFRGDIFEMISGRIPGLILSEDVDRSEDWAIEIESVEEVKGEK